MVDFMTKPCLQTEINKNHQTDWSVRVFGRGLDCSEVEELIITYQLNSHICA